MIPEYEYQRTHGIFMRLIPYRGIKRFYVESLDESASIASRIYFYSEDEARYFGETYLIRYNLGVKKDEVESIS